MTEHADATLAFAVKSYPTAAAMLVRAHYNFAYSDNRSLCINMCSRAEQRAPWFDEEFTIFYYRKMNEESFAANEGNRDMVSYLKLQQTMNVARRYDEACSRWQVRTLFFSALSLSLFMHCSM
jgi:hypothetical protein